MRHFSILIIAASLAASNAHADYLRWSAAPEDDPFARDRRMIMNYMDSQDSGLFIICEEQSDRITIRLALPLAADDYRLPTYDFLEQVQIDDFNSHIQYADDVTLANGNIGLDADIEGESARYLLDDLVEAQRSFYIKVTDITETIRLPVTGSTAAANAMLNFCMTEASIPEPVPELTEEDRKKKTIDWEEYKREQDRQLEEARPLTVPPTDKQSAIAHIANARAIAHICKSEELDPTTLSSISARWKIDMNIDGPDFNPLLTATDDRIASHKTNREEATCHTGNYLYGPEGRAIPNLIRRLQ
ncbi:hypothetical protein [uncultured Martelella sp.]|uniref:hypothetical protein n=1 Tax=uncultured Martelella sp. TaxID=392331 RepID=UPI0029C60B47|nr:hypothetical protein [uncultured Martelella sp.]